mmetsp:Transcript_29363/g.49563  ORF Transcript_29363/g.49563 Transcript_29363/m.49563 type:complete len:630 (+) Transcript_29363:140-2029(+)
MNKSYNYKPSEEEEEEFENEEKNAAASAVSGTPFNVLMQQAGKLKSKQGESARKAYDNYPPWYQHSMFAQDDVVAARNMNFTERMTVAMNFKEKGTASLKADELYDAMHDYERALSVFKWIENMKDDWKKKEIEDSMIKEFDFVPASPQESEEVRVFQCSCLLNLALVYSRQLQWSYVILACTAVLELDSSNTKALFRRAQARYRPVYCGVTENEIALADLKHAVSLKPSDPLIKREYVKLKRELEQQRVKDTKQFGGLFNRGRVVQDGDLRGDDDAGSGRMSVDEALKSLKDAESACQRYYEDGRLDDADRLQATVTRLRKDIDEFTAQQREKAAQAAAQEPARNPFLDINLEDITPKQLEDAAKSGLDLNDPKVREYIAEIQKELQLKEGQKSKLNITSEPKEEMKSVMDRLESRKLVDILSKGLEADENKELVKHLLANRLAYVEKFEMPSVRVEELDDDDESGDENYSHSKSSTIIERDSPFETLYEYMLDDISELYEEETSRMDARDGKEEGDNSFSGRIMAMMDEKYQLHAVEKELRGQQSFDWRGTLLYTILGFILFRFFIIPNYNRFCDSYCGGVDCSDSMLCSPLPATVSEGFPDDSSSVEGAVKSIVEESGSEFDDYEF